ncbi:putative Ser/Thr protein kinase [Legionella quinlivanii]|uniref:Putative Ser/Thr protein kinase n=1 Tax=Legionella quinlivanii TaxID=45073 RepID=A0A0W0XY93_9GAMM|nr:DUF547 domain-containing protein [Legionella quinlivanii]KTD49691.1 putative Ser/Thr protein kinase [Legionella quinlivanii]MCW8451942.1 DUF547 domain-containing protein [Legionella quinlivanii]SEG30103.1 Protein of unknown function, DUF547 [Legionella quinlivanii DSM 21216]STY09861.1 putative Ser/Thr protein kinase [Legionella quinlivanii]
MSKSLRITVLFLLLFITGNIFASFNKSLWPIWEVNNPLSKAVIQHSEWQEFLQKHLITNEEGINLIDYPNVRETDRLLLKKYIERMSGINISEYNRAEQLAYWINVYNAITVHTVASYFPVNSIDEINISPGLFSIGPWGAKLITVNNISLSLDEIQNRIIRPIWNDSRCHYALNNGAIGAPNLGKQVYTGEKLEQQLNLAAFDYVNSLRGVQVIEGELVVSKIYDWFSEDFGETKQNVINHIRQFAKEPLKHQLKHVNTIDNYVYNWHLNTTVKNQAG